jgi:nucleoside-diphosphate-sugar epimerase
MLNVAGHPRILVTGARGFLGSHVVARARAEGRVTISTHRGVAERGELHLDICDAASVDKALHAARPSVVIHCASYGVNYADQDSSQALSVNLHGSLRLLTAAARHGINRFVHIGSCFEYGSHAGQITEDAALNPTAIYGATKAATTLLMRQRAHELGITLLIARPFGIWGPGEASYRLIPQVITACMGRTRLGLTSCGVLRDYTFVEDMADTIVSLALIPDVVPGTIVNIGSGHSTVLRDFVMSVARLMDGEALMCFGELESRPTEMTSLVPDVRQLQKMIGDRPETPLAEGVRRSVSSLNVPSHL